MPDPLVVDVHVHVFAEADDPMRDGYEIWEYGERSDVEFSERRGTVDDLLDSLVDSPCAHCVVLGMFVPEVEIGSAGRLPCPNGCAPTTSGSWPRRASHPGSRRWWRPTPRYWVEERAPSTCGWPPSRGPEGSRCTRSSRRFLPDDPRMTETYAVCEELGLTVLSHSGTSHAAPQWADPFAFSAVMEAHPRLHLLLAHLGGASWHQIREFAAAYPTVSFDLCEIIAWTGAPGAPTSDELGRLIRDIGAERVLFGTDFPWYEVDRTIDQLMDLPHLSDEERRGILGENAVRRMGLVIADTAT